MKLKDPTLLTATACRSAFEISPWLGNIQVDGAGALTELRAGATDPDAKAQRAELITLIRGGKHVELAVSALTFRQRKTPGAPNRRFVRLGGDLGASASTFKGLPFLTDHDTHTQSSRKGTILGSKLVDDKGRDAFEMSFNVVKPDAVISVIDGTIDSFSISWFPLGPVFCTLHGVDVRGRDSCHCWLGETVEVDGKPRIVEYEFSIWEGKELSGVNVPAVKGTRISDIRADLAAELELPPKEIQQMAFPRLAAVLKLTALAETDEPSAVAAVEALERRALTAESKLATTQMELTAATAGLAAASKIRIDDLLSGCYRAGKLKHGRDAAGLATPSPREERLRKIAARDGIVALEAELAELDVIVPVGQRLQVETVGAPPASTAAPEGANPNFQRVADQLGLKVEDMVAFQREQGGVS
jgi:hypothetical protein